MTFQATPAPVPLGYGVSGMVGALAGSATTGTFQVNASGEKLYFIFQAPDTFTADAFCFRLTAVGTGSATGLTATVEGVNAANGRPDGVVNGSSVTVDTTGGAGIFVVTGLNASLTKGVFYAVGVTWAAGDVTVATRITNGSPTVTPRFGYYYSFDGTTHANASSSEGLLFAVGTGSTAWKATAGAVSPYTAATTRSYTSSDATADECGLIFQYPVPVRLWGVLAGVQQAASNGNGKLDAYSAPLGTPASLSSMSVAIDPEIGQASSLDGLRHFIFGSTADLDANTDYAISFTATGAGNFSLDYVDVSSSDKLQAWLGVNFRWGQRNNGSGAFTETTTRFPIIIPLVSALHDGAGGGGGGLVKFVGPGGGFVG